MQITHLNLKKLSRHYEPFLEMTVDLLGSIVIIKKMAESTLSKIIAPPDYRHSTPALRIFIHIRSNDDGVSPPGLRSDTIHGIPV